MPMVYVGSNDGRMYGFRGDVGAADSGVEKFSYVPGGVYHNLSHLTDPSYSHRYYVDGSIAVGDAYLDGGWRTVLVAGLNAGGNPSMRSMLRTPTLRCSGNVLWEFDLDDDDVTRRPGPDLQQPQIGILEKAAAGSQSLATATTARTAALTCIIVDLLTGKLIQKLTARMVQTTITTGFRRRCSSTPMATDDRRGLCRRSARQSLEIRCLRGIGDLGCCDGEALFHGDAGDGPQPITAQPKVAPHPVSGQLVLFGTGRYLERTTSSTRADKPTTASGITTAADRDTCEPAGAVLRSTSERLWSHRELRHQQFGRLGRR